MPACAETDFEKLEEKYEAVMGEVEYFVLPATGEVLAEIPSNDLRWWAIAGTPREARQKLVLLVLADLGRGQA